MADEAMHTQMTNPAGPVDLETGISLIEAGQAEDSLVVDLGDGCLARADGRKGLQGLLQRLRGHRALTSMAYSTSSEALVSMRSVTPDMHPDVVAILDALKHRA